MASCLPQRILMRAAASRYQGQAAPYQLLLGSLYERLGKEEDAKRALTNALERDPESHAAKEAADRLQRWAT